MRIPICSCLLLLCLGACDGENPSPPISGNPNPDPGLGDIDPESLDVERLTVVAPQTNLTVEEGDSFNMPVYLIQPKGQDDADLENVVWSLRARGSFTLDQLSYNFGPSSRSVNSSASELQFSQPISMLPINTSILELEVVAETASIVTTLPISITVQPVEAPDVYLLIGQSNMEGYSEENAKDAGPGGADEVHPRIWQLNVHGNTRDHYPSDADFVDEQINTASPILVPAEDPLHRPRDLDVPSKSGTLIGPGLSFAKAAVTQTSQRVFLVPAAWGGTAFCADSKGEIGWNSTTPTNPSLRGTLLTDRALLRLNMALRETEGIFRGIVWHQGESDSFDTACANSYADNLFKLVARIRTEARLDARGSNARGVQAAIPFVLGTMSKGNDERGAFAEFLGGKITVDQVHRNIKSLIPFSEVANADDLVPPAYPCGERSCIHFGAAAYRELGARLYLALSQINQ